MKKQLLEKANFARLNGDGPSSDGKLSDAGLDDAVLFVLITVDTCLFSLLFEGSSPISSISSHKTDFIALSIPP